ncbi:hypothetical protein ABW19_dt0202744 [Dactylella cylindrospora]|nr:hypothetical protein ABW19_dt0202744 [Dactylella cylindrospora]
MAFELLYIVSSFMIKYSFLFLYLRISKETKKIKWFLRGAFLITTLTFIFCILALFLTCMPVSDFWNIRNPKPQCERKILLTYGSGISNIVTDTIVLAIPVPLILQASLNKKQIRGVYVLYLCGAFVIVASVLRFVTQLMGVSMLQTMGWSQLEVSLALILACAPMGAKLLSSPLIQHTGCPLAALRRSNNFGRQYDYTSPFDKTLPTPPTVMTLIRGGSIHVSRMGLNSQDKTNSTAQEDPRTRRAAMAKRGVLVKEMKSPMYRKLKLGTTTSTNGQTVWEVQPLSATTATTATETTFSFPSRSPTIGSSARDTAGGLAPPPGWTKDLLKRKEAAEEEEKEKERERVVSGIASGGGGDGGESSSSSAPIVPKKDEEA